jgi:hypothetical protein
VPAYVHGCDRLGGDAGMTRRAGGAKSRPGSFAETITEPTFGNDREVGVMLDIIHHRQVAGRDRPKDALWRSPPDGAGHAESAQAQCLRANR